ncbi:MAG: PTS fructose transporter subunit IIA [Chromatiales bacterium]|nr:PTS fructose transporter subunit IIA [Chromatiales bacterium]
MSVGLLLITHGGVGSALLQTALTVLGHQPMAAKLIACQEDCDPDKTLELARATVEDLDRGDGVLVLTDLYGSTPGNIAVRLHEPGRVAVVSGANVPMLVRVFNYYHMSLGELTDKAAGGGRMGIVIASPPEADQPRRPS